MAESDHSQEPIVTNAPSAPGRGARFKRKRNADDHIDDGQRPKAVYAILFGGVAALLGLLLVIYLSSDRSVPDQPICSTVSANYAQNAVLQGRIRGITLAYDDTAEPPSAPNWGPVLLRLTYTDGQCAILPQGVMYQDELYRVVGAVQVYNDITENPRIEIKYDRTTSLDESLFFTPTPIPTNTPIPSPTPIATPTPQVTPSPTPTEIVGPVFELSTPSN